MTPILSDLRAPPEVGRFYLVPVIRDVEWCGHRHDWPVLGPLHSDADFFNFPAAHYHVDARFLTKRQQRVGEKWARWHGPATVERAVGAAPLADWRQQVIPRGRPSLARRRCVRASYGYAYEDKDQVQRLRQHFGGSPVEPIRRGDGRLLCPHRKVDLSSFPPDPDGLVICPLHGLHVRCGGPA